MSTRDRDRWDEKYGKREALSTIEPDEWLVEAIQLIQSSHGTTECCGRALDIACGRGNDAIWLAMQGWQVDAVDISPKGLALAQQAAQANDVRVSWIEADLDDWCPAANQYDSAIVFRFLDRDTVPRIVQTAVRPGGWVVYETFSAAQCERPGSHISNPAFALAPGELVTLFPDFDVVVHREDVLRDRTVERFLGRRRPSG